MSAPYIQVHFSIDFYMEAINMNPDQTAPLDQSELSSYCLQYRLSKNKSRQEEQTTTVVTGGLRVNVQTNPIIWILRSIFFLGENTLVL